MGIACNIARLVPNGSGLLPNANIEAVAASKLTGQVPDANAPSGSVVQTILARSESNNAFSTSSTSLVGVGALEASITPISSSNKILVMVCMAVGMDGWSAGTFKFGLNRNGSTIFGDFRSLENYGADSGNSPYDSNTYGHFMYLDSPSTTSSTTYAPALGTSNGVAIYLNRYYGQNNQRGISYMLLQEIAA